MASKIIGWIEDCFAETVIAYISGWLVDVLDVIFPSYVSYICAADIVIACAIKYRHSWFKFRTEAKSINVPKTRTWIDRDNASNIVRNHPAARRFMPN